MKNLTSLLSAAGFVLATTAAPTLASADTPIHDLTPEHWAGEVAEAGCGKGGCGKKADDKKDDKKDEKKDEKKKDKKGSEASCGKGGCG